MSFFRKITGDKESLFIFMSFLEYWDTLNLSKMIFFICNIELNGVATSPLNS